MTTVVSVAAFTASGVALLVTLDLVDSLVAGIVRRVRPRHTPRQHYPGGPYLAASSGAADPMIH